MASGSFTIPLAETDVLVIDCQATAAAPRGRLLELGWARAGTVAAPEARLIRIPEGERIPPAVVRITGITDGMMRAGVDGDAAWRALWATAAALAYTPVPTVIHYARFEQPYLQQLAGGVPPLDLVCTHAIASRLLPDLPRRSLRALAGYFGGAVGVLRRSADHVAATVFVWRQLVHLLAGQGVATWSDLKTWLAASAQATGQRRRVWPMPREVRLALPDAPGVYRMLRTGGDVLYVGKAVSLHRRVNSYFRHQRGVPERMLEMLSQARGISFDECPTALEAALLEPDEIKRLRPPYNIALTADRRDLWFASSDLLERAVRPSARCPIGPFPTADLLVEFAALAGRSAAALGRGRWSPGSAVFDEGYARFHAAHAEMSDGRLRAATRLLRLGTRLWREGRRDWDIEAEEFALTAQDRRGTVWTSDSVQLALEWIAVRAALARRRATWFTLLTQASIAWREPGAGQARLLLIDDGDLVLRSRGDAEDVPPVPPGYRRCATARREPLTVARFDRLRVLTTEIKRLAAAGAPVAVRFGSSPPLAGPRLASVLAWV